MLLLCGRGAPAPSGPASLCEVILVVSSWSFFFFSIELSVLLLLSFRSSLHILDKNVFCYSCYKSLFSYSSFPGLKGIYIYIYETKFLILT